jgi:putative tributyrin esterase
MSMRTLVATLLLSGCVAAPASAELRQASFHSTSLGRDVSYVADLPDSYASGSRRYPVVYALHGLFESSAFWERRGLAAALQKLRSDGAVPELIVIAPDGDNSFFVNGPEGRYEDMVTRDLVAHVDATYRTVAKRAGRALFGVSMGGYGALRMALEHPDLFAAAATHSAMLLEAIPTQQEGAGRWQMTAFHRAFGDPIDAGLWRASDPLRLALSADPKTAPRLYFDCGSEDRYGLFAGNRDLHERLAARGVAHEFALHPGDHGYAYVATVIGRSLRFLGDALGDAAAGPAGPRPSEKETR